MVTEQKTADVSFDSLLRIFTVPEGPDSTLTQIEDKLSRNLNQFLREHIVAKKAIAWDWKIFECSYPEQPGLFQNIPSISSILLASHSVHTSSPSFIGHMTSAFTLFPDAAVKNHDCAKNQI